MKKYVVETYYTCTFKTVHTLNNLDDKELSKIDQRTDGEVEVIDVVVKELGTFNRDIPKLSLMTGFIFWTLYFYSTLYQLLLVLYK